MAEVLDLGNDRQRMGTYQRGGLARDAEDYAFSAEILKSQRRFLHETFLHGGFCGQECASRSEEQFQGSGLAQH